MENVCLLCGQTLTLPVPAGILNHRYADYKEDKMKRIIIIALAALVLGSCASTDGKNNNPPDVIVITGTVTVGFEHDGDFSGAAGEIQYLRVALDAGKSYTVEWVDIDNMPAMGAWIDIEVGLMRETTGSFVKPVADNPPANFTYTVPSGEGGNYIVAVRRKCFNEDTFSYRLSVIETIDFQDAGDGWFHGNLHGPAGIKQYIRVPVDTGTVYRIEWQDNHMNDNMTAVTIHFKKESTGFTPDINTEYGEDTNHRDYWVPAAETGNYLIVVQKINHALNPSINDLTRYNLKWYIMAG